MMTRVGGTRARSLAVAALLGAFGMACGPSHIKAYEPKRRDYQPVVPVEEHTEGKTEGSLWTARAEGGTLFTDVRAFEVNDIVTIRIKESARADRQAETSLDRNGSLSMGGDVVGPGTDTSKKVAVNAQTSNDFDSTGKTARRDDVAFTVAATVTKVLPNGNLFIEGHRVVLVNEEEHHYYISGVARPQDIDRENTIMSFQLADAEVEFTGRGVISEGQEPGWLTRILNFILPI